MGALREYGEKLLSRSRTPLERGPRCGWCSIGSPRFESTAPESGSHAIGGLLVVGAIRRWRRGLIDRLRLRSQDSSAPAEDIFQPPQTSPRKNSAPEHSRRSTASVS